MPIKILSESTINRIAAGEVIERPASVIKELVENSIDAGATKIDIILEQAGKNLIIISDNGIGMSPEDLELAVKRHTTSKLDEDDLLNINSFGFRGEALPSIASISKMSITSKAKNQDKAYVLHLIGGKDAELKPAAHNEGTKIEIRDLFFATPARLKFLRTDKTEFAASLDIVKKLALAHPALSFSLTHDGKNILTVKARPEEKEAASKQRIIDIIGEEFASNASKVDLNREGLTITGYTSLPTYNRASGEDQFLFINNRAVKDKVLNMALRAAYQDYLASGRHAVAALFLYIDPKEVDVNVHPAKSEVRFRDPNLVRGLLIAAIRDALSTTSGRVSNHLAANAFGYFNKNPNNSIKPQIIPSSPIWSHGPKSYNSYNNVAESPREFRAAPLIYTAPQSNIVVEEPYPTAPEEFPLGAAKAQLHSTYIISQTADSIIIVDQHAAHERLGYEKIKQAMQENGLIKQRLLIPEIVELPDANRAQLLYEAKDQLSKLGLTLEKFGKKSIIVSEIPSLLGDINIAALIMDLGDHLLEIGDNLGLTQLIEHVTETYACHYSIRAGRKLLGPEMNELLRQMENTPFSGQCNHGRPTYVELKLKDIEKLFGRR